MGGRRARASFRYRAFVPDPIAAPHAHRPVRGRRCRGRRRGRDPGAERAGDRRRARGDRPAAPAVGGRGLVAHRGLRRLVAQPRPRPHRSRGPPGAARGRSPRTSPRWRRRSRSPTGRARSGPDDLLAIHATLMAGDERARPGRLREEQNWIGGRLGNPSDAAFVPPPEDLVGPLLEDLVAFIARDDLPAVAQAAIAHAQFETIHPFIDGNGRVGRALIHVILRRRGAATRFVPPVSIVLAARPAAYVDGLTAFREGPCRRLGRLLLGGRRASCDSVDRPRRPGRRAAGRCGASAPADPRSDSAAARLIALLPALPVLSAPTARGAIGVSQQQTLAALKSLARGGRPAPDQQRDLRPPVRCDRAVRPAHGVRGTRGRPPPMRLVSSGQLLWPRPVSRPSHTNSPVVVAAHPHAPPTTLG